MTNIYHKITDNGDGLSVSIDRYGITAAEMTPVEGLIENPEGPYLVVSNTWSWDNVRSRNRCYSGDDGAGRCRDRLVAAAISLLGYWGGEETFIQETEDFEPVG